MYEYLLRFYNQNTKDFDLVRLFYKNGYIVTGVALGEEDINDYKGDKSWFGDVMDTSIVEENEVYISPISIARRTNTAAMRHVMSVDVEDKRLGLVIINFKASSFYDVMFNNLYEEGGRFILVDKKYENAEGEALEGAITLADSNNKSYVLDENEEAVSIIGVDQLDGDRGYLGFTEEGRE